MLLIKLDAFKILGVLCAVKDFGEMLFTKWRCNMLISIIDYKTIRTAGSRSEVFKLFSS